MSFQDCFLKTFMKILFVPVQLQIRARRKRVSREMADLLQKNSQVWLGAERLTPF